MHENDLIKERFKKLEALRAMGVRPYGGRFERTSDIKPIVDEFTEGRKVRLAGRLTAVRSHGKSNFCDLIDSTGRIQFYVKEGALEERSFQIFQLADMGDFLGIEGELFKTRTGEPSVKVEKLEMLSKSLRPLPEKWHGLKDVETRFRHRYLDLCTNQDVKDIFKKRSQVVASIRNYLDAQNYLEVETPMMHPIPGGAAGKPFKTHHEALDVDLYLRVAPELYLKRLLVGGFEKVYEVNKSFRNEGISTRHNPEFTMLEVYTAYHDVNDVMALCQGLIQNAAMKLYGKLTIEFENFTLDLSQWDRVSFAGLMKQNFDIDPDDAIPTWIEKLKKKGVQIEGKELSRMQLINIVGEMIEPTASGQIGEGGRRIERPMFVTDYFTELCPLAKKNADNPHISERFELYLTGMEVANGYSELNDPIDQRERLLEELREKGKTATADTIDEDFLLALEHGMPPAGGLGIGIDRIVMALTHQPTIREVILFPQMKPEK